MAYRKEVQELGLKSAVRFVLGRHDSAVLNLQDREQVHGYIYWPNYDPGLSEKGRKSVAETTRPPVDRWYSSPAKRAIETTLAFCHDFQHANTEDAFRPADYSGVPESVVDQYMVDFDDDALYAAYAATGAPAKDQARALQRLGELIQEADASYKGLNIPFGVISHDEICRQIMAYALGLPVEQFTDDQCKIARGAFVIITVNPNGEIAVERSE